MDNGIDKDEIAVSCCPSGKDGGSDCSSTADAYADGLSDESSRSEEDTDRYGVNDGWLTTTRVGDGSLEMGNRGGGRSECIAREEDALGGGDR